MLITRSQVNLSQTQSDIFKAAPHPHHSTKDCFTVFDISLGFEMLHMSGWMWVPICTRLCRRGLLFFQNKSSFSFTEERDANMAVLRRNAQDDELQPITVLGADIS